MKAHIQSYNDRIYKTREQMAYIDEKDQWRGPAKVLGMEEKTIHISHNGLHRKIANCKARPWDPDMPEELGAELSETEDEEGDTDENGVTSANKDQDSRRIPRRWRRIIYTLK